MKHAPPARPAQRRPGRLVLLALAGIVLAGGILRFAGLGSAEPLFDEGAYAFRAAGYLDYLEDPAQRTPLEFFRDRPAPAWLSLSFHDAPPLFFLVGHAAFGLLGVSLFAARVPSALAGLGSIVIAFFAVRLLFSRLADERLRRRRDWAGLAAAALLAVSFSSVAVSRLDQIESLLFFLMLLNAYLFLLFLEDERWWWAFGISFGLCLLTKYTCVILLPAYALSLLAIRSPLFKAWRWYGAFLVSAIIFSPVVAYNIELYRTFGHLDLQFAYLFREAVPGWSGMSGKTEEPVSHLAANLGLIYSLPYLALALTGFVLSLVRKELKDKASFPAFLCLSTFAFLTALGAAVRFVSYLVLPAAFLVPIALVFISERFGRPFLVFFAIAVLFFSYETYVTAASVFWNKPDYGIVKLDSFFDRVFGDGRPAGTLTHPNPTLNAVIQKYAARHRATLPPVGIVYDDRIATPARLWLFSRRQYYQGIPIMPASQFLDLWRASRAKSLAGFEIYFVEAEPATTISPVADPKYLEALRAFFAALPAAATFEIRGALGVPAFTVGRFALKAGG